MRKPPGVSEANVKWSAALPGAALSIVPPTPFAAVQNLLGSRTKSAEEKKKNFVIREMFDETEKLTFE